MSKLNLSVAIGDYDRNRPLIDGAVQIDGVDPVFMKLYPEEIFFRAFRAEEFDICECSLSSFSVKTAAGNCPYVGVPAFVSRMFRHTSIYVPHRPHQEAGGPEGQEGRRAGISAHGQRLGARDPGRRFRRQAVGHALDPRRHRARRTAGEDHHQAAGGRAARQRAGGQDHFANCWRRARSTASWRRGRRRCESENIGWLFRDPVAAAKDYYKRTGIFPIMHLIGVRRTLAEKHPWLPAAVLKAFEQSKAAAMAHLWDTSATKVTLPFVEERVAETRALMGDDYWPYGVEREPQDAGDVPAPPSCAGAVVAAASRSRNCSTRARWRASRFDSAYLPLPQPRQHLEAGVAVGRHRGRLFPGRPSPPASCRCRPGRRGRRCRSRPWSVAAAVPSIRQASACARCRGRAARTALRRAAGR